jgi:magnesium-transporting ATPase (P-type)
MVMWHCVFVAAILVTSVLLNFQWELDRHPKVETNSTGTRRAGGGDSVPPRIRNARACAFNMLVFGEIAFAINCRYIRESSISMKTLTGNKWCWVAIFITVVLQVLVARTIMSERGSDTASCFRI